MEESNKHLLTQTAYFGRSVESARAVVVLVHGRMQDPIYMYDNVVAKLLMEDIAYVAPAANNGSWYPKTLLAPISDNEPELTHMVQRLDQVRDQLFDAQVGANKIVWCGFSQGACAVSHYVGLNPQRWGGLIAFTGGLIGPPGSKWKLDGNFLAMPTYFGGSDVDEFVPEVRMRDSAEAFAVAGADVCFEVHMGRQHEICQREISRARDLIAEVG